MHEGGLGCGLLRYSVERSSKSGLKDEVIRMLFLSIPHHILTSAPPYYSLSINTANIALFNPDKDILNFSGKVILVTGGNVSLGK